MRGRLRALRRRGRRAQGSRVFWAHLSGRHAWRVSSDSAITERAPPLFHAAPLFVCVRSCAYAPLQQLQGTAPFVSKGVVTLWLRAPPATSPRASSFVGHAQPLGSPLGFATWLCIAGRGEGVLEGVDCVTQDNDSVVVCSCTRDLNRSKLLWPSFVAPRCHAQCPLGSSCSRQLADAARDFADRLLRCVYASALQFARVRGQDVCRHALWTETLVSIARVLIRPARRWWAGGRGGGGSCSALCGQASVAPQEVPQVSLEPVATPALSAGIPVYSPSPGCDRSSKRRGSSRSRHNGHLRIREHFRLRFRCTPPPPRVAISACLCGGGALARAIWAQPYILKVAWRVFRGET